MNTAIIAVIGFLVLLVVFLRYRATNHKIMNSSPSTPPVQNTQNGDTDVSGIQQMLLGAGGAAAKYTGTVTIAYDTDSTTYEQYIYYNGAFGSASPTTLTDGKTFLSVDTYNSPIGSFSTNDLYISGFASDPGSSYLTTIKIGSTTYTLSGYTYGAGIAAWNINTGSGWFSGTGAYTIVLT